MTRYVIGPDVAYRLADDRAVIGDEHRLVAPTLLRSQLLSLHYHAVRRGDMTKKDAEQRLDYVRGLRIRLLGDRVLQSVAWKIADQLGWSGTFDAEYVALTQLQADAFITLDSQLAHAVQAPGDGRQHRGAVLMGCKRERCLSLHDNLVWAMRDEHRHSIQPVVAPASGW